jgi:hypothetical protein
VPGTESVDVLRCDLCGRPCDEVNGGQDELRLELTREDLSGDQLYWVGDFCTQEHAAEWLRRPLPEALSTPEPVPPTWSDRAALGGCLGLVALAVAIFVLGAWRALQLLLDGL